MKGNVMGEVLTKEQILFLKSELSAAYQSKRWRHDSSAKPAEVKKTERIIHQWEHKRNKEQTRHKERLDNEHLTAREAILFGDAKTARAAVARFKKLKV